MNIQNVQIQAFLERMQGKIMRKIEDEYYCDGCLFESQEKLDQFKQVWQQKLKQQFVIQNQQYLSKNQTNAIEEVSSKLIKRKDDNQNNEFEKNPQKMIKQEVNSSQDDVNCLKTEQNNHSQQIQQLNLANETKESLNKQKKQTDSFVKNEDDVQKNEGQKQEEEEIDYMKILENIKYKDNQIKQISDKDEGNLENENKINENCNFNLDSNDLDDVSDQIIDEGYFNEFDNYLIGYIGKERKTKKKCKEQNKPITSIDFSNLIGTVNKQEIIITSLRTNLVDCRK